MTEENLRQLPSVDRLLSEGAIHELVATYGRRATVGAVREALDCARTQVRAGQSVPGPQALVKAAAARLSERLGATLRPVINATGVVIHTNLGRAPLSDDARRAIDAVAGGYSTLEYDLGAGRRGQRIVHAETLLCELTGAEASLVVNNNAGAVLLALTGLARGRGVVISRGQLIEIGGGFRIPDVMAQSGARLVEVGTTNRTHTSDYGKAFEADDEVGLIFRAHHSNYRIVGFAGEPSVAELVALGVEHGVPVVDDLGSGALLDTARYGLAHEPMVQESVAAGAALVSFSGDKLLGGPQAGIIVGEARYVEPLKRHPLARALRADKLCLAGLQATLLHYLRDEAGERVPVWRMIATPVSQIERRARKWQEVASAAGIRADVIEGRSTVGGGSLPGETLPTRLLAVDVESPDAAASALRASCPPVIARIEDDRLLLDPRTVMPEADEALLRALKKACTRESS